MKFYYVIRSGWNAANQSSIGCVRNPAEPADHEFFRGVLAIKAENCTSGEFAFLVSMILTAS